MPRKVLWVKEDFYKREGDIVSRFEGKYKIIDMKHQNRYGEFILCEYMEEKQATPGWQRVAGVASSSENSYEILGVIDAPGYRNLLGGIGYYIKDARTQGIKGVSYHEAWNLIFQNGATNAIASKSQSGSVSTRLLDTINELPSLDSQFWKIPAYHPDGTPFAPLSEQAKIELKKGLTYAVRSLARDVVSEIRIDSEIDESSVSQFEQFIEQAKVITVLTGAGISTMSGIPDYRTAAVGMWKKDPSILEDLNEMAFQANPVRFWARMYELLVETLNPIMPFKNHESLLAAIEGIEPNQGHRFFRWLEQLDKEVTIVTQNVDGLHQKAGSSDVVEFHGNIRECYCPSCGKSYPLVRVLREGEAPRCECGGILRPDVVFFGDPVKSMDRANSAIRKADLIIVAGTSLQVTPFNQLLESKKEGSRLVYLNADVSSEERFDLVLKGNISGICRHVENEFKVDEKDDELEFLDN
ncbi:Sir2 family NAD-dependent protein deacetylase [Neobacillus niacini]|uniref:SIR2 family NAD-dependent protein deacylase n=1 Tax=Neobacillus niacini TaxID=86668 RepID=UPI0021CB501F|nr:Sir2 family NAD-dependent protein deacetylase [Neobacillus niacini]MCM3763824.1 hypothetical protein [Neobacillus niacini]